ncbi:MAG: hypothetical protein LBI57_01590 [Helicobacteraceae bacterium]|jgi:hypothetical protein|nr:hypothetical protein [Helicobacteraceae bacterium]
MRLFCLFLFFFAPWALASSATDKVIELYQNKEYERACLEGARIARDNRADETFLNAYGFACLNSDYIDFAALAGIYLRNTPGSRQNASYILTVALQKKLLYQSLADGVDLGDTHLPDTPHILSKVFNAYAAGKYEKRSDGSYYIDLDGDPVLLDAIVENSRFKVRIRRLSGTRVVAEHLYW